MSSITPVELYSTKTGCSVQQRVDTVEFPDVAGNDGCAIMTLFVLMVVCDMKPERLLVACPIAHKLLTDGYKREIL